MSAKIKCDGCGQEVSMVIFNGDYHKPSHWFQRSDKDGIQDACSRECIPKISVKSGKTDLVLPF